MEQMKSHLSKHASVVYLWSANYIPGTELSGQDKNR